MYLPFHAIDTAYSGGSCVNIDLCFFLWAFAAPVGTSYTSYISWPTVGVLTSLLHYLKQQQQMKVNVTSLPLRGFV